MSLEPREPFHNAPGVIDRLDARLKLLLAIAYVIGVVATPAGWWKLLGLEAFFLTLLIGIAGIPPWQLFRRWLGFFFLVGFVSLLVAPRHPARIQLGVSGVVLTTLSKNSMAFLMMLLLAETTPFPRLLSSLRRLGVPQSLVSTLQFMFRYQFVLGEELERMLTARRARSFRRSGLPNWKQLTGSIAMLFIRTMERAERVHAAMTARGWDGTVRELEV